MPLQELVQGSNPARDDVQQTDFGYDVVSRYICNNWGELAGAQGAGAYPFEVIVIVIELVPAGVTSGDLWPSTSSPP